MLLLFLAPLTAWSQQNRLINTHSWQYEYMQRLQQRGYLLSLNPSDLPYTAGDLQASLNNVEQTQLSRREQRWYKLLNDNVERKPAKIDSMRVGGYFKAGARHSSSDRLNVDDPLGEGELALPRGELKSYLEWDRWIAQAGITFDWFYDIDPDGTDLADLLYIRSEEVYFGYNSDMVDLYVGRFDNHWSLHDRQGAFLTDNPRSFDQLQLKFGTSKLSFSSIIGEMDNMKADSTFSSGHSYELGAFRRYLFLHRLDWSPRPNLKLSFIEGELYFSQTASLSLRNLIPLHFLLFESGSPPLNNNTNVMFGGSVWYNTGPLTLYLQGMIDDFVVEDRQELRENNELIPTTYTINSSVTLAGINDSFDIGLETDLVSANSYRSFRYQDQWTYAQRGLATNFSDYVRTKLYATIYPDFAEGLKLEPALTLYYKGVGDLRDLRTSTEPDGSQIPGILSGTVERTVRPSLYLRYQPMTRNLFENSRFNVWFDADIGMNFMDNVDNIEGQSDSRFIGLFRIFGEVTF